MVAPLVMNYEQAVRSASILRCGNDSGCAPRRTPPAPTTVGRSSVCSEAFNAYLYTEAWVKKIIKEIGTVEKCRDFFGKEPRLKKVPALPRQADPVSAVPEQQPMIRSA